MHIYIWFWQTDLSCTIYLAYYIDMSILLRGVYMDLTARERVHGTSVSSVGRGEGERWVWRARPTCGKRKTRKCHQHIL